MSELLADTRGHDLSVANGVEHEAPKSNKLNIEA